MTEAAIAYVNGAFVPASEAKVSIFDRGFLFADGIYEVAAVLDGKLVDLDAHLDRLGRSAKEIRLALPMTHPELAAMLRELAARNGTSEGMVYLEVTRGAAPARDFAFPSGVTPTVVAFAQSFPILASQKGNEGAAVVTVPEVRWKRRDIKSVALLGQVLARQTAVSAGAAEAFFVDEADGTITEGAASNAYIVKDGVLVTRPLGFDILHGTTRARVLEVARVRGIGVEERAFSLEELLRADEAFYTGAAAFVVPAVRIDDRPIGDGKPGPITRALREGYIEAVRRTL